MNIFYTDACPAKSAQALCDKHVVKMPLESAQMLSTAWRKALSQQFTKTEVDQWCESHGYYKIAHPNHPSTLWVMHSESHYNWLFRHYVALCLEYQYRYNRVHKSFGLFDQLKDCPTNILDRGFTQPPTCMPDEYKISKDSTKCYKAYLRNAKAHFSKWTARDQPDWWCEAFNPFLK